MTGLAVVVALFCLAYPSYNRYVAKSQVTAAISHAGALKPRIVAYIASGKPCEALVDHAERAGLGKSQRFDGRFVARVAIGQGCALKAYLTIDDAIAAPLAGKIVTLHPGYRTDAGFAALGGALARSIGPRPLSWRCTSNADERYLPVACTQRTGVTASGAARDADALR